MECPATCSSTKATSSRRRPTEIVAYPQLKVKLAEIDELIAKNPNDPIGLTERGELRLDKGDLAGAIDDLARPQEQSRKEIRDKARAKLYDTLTAYIADHFNDAEKYLTGIRRTVQDRCRGRSAERTQQVGGRAARAAAPRFSGLVGKGRRGTGPAGRGVREISAVCRLRPASSPNWCPPSMTGRSRPLPMFGRVAGSSP